MLFNLDKLLSLQSLGTKLCCTLNRKLGRRASHISYNYVSERGTIIINNKVSNEKGINKSFIKFLICQYDEELIFITIFKKSKQRNLAKKSESTQKLVTIALIYYNVDFDLLISYSITIISFLDFLGF